MRYQIRLSIILVRCKSVFCRVMNRVSLGVGIVRWVKDGISLCISKVRCVMCSLFWVLTEFIGRIIGLVCVLVEFVA